MKVQDENRHNLEIVPTLLLVNELVQDNAKNNLNAKFQQHRIV